MSYNHLELWYCYRLLWCRLLTTNESQDYIHRVGRTARAGRSGVAITLVNQLEIGSFCKIESLIGKPWSTWLVKPWRSLSNAYSFVKFAGKMLPKHHATHEEVMRLSEGVTEATRLAVKVMRAALSTTSLFPCHYQESGISLYRFYISFAEYKRE